MSAAQIQTTKTFQQKFKSLLSDCQQIQLYMWKCKVAEKGNRNKPDTKVKHQEFYNHPPPPSKKKGGGGVILVLYWHQ